MFSLCPCLSSAAGGEIRSSGAISALAFSPDGKDLAIGMYGQVVVVDTTTWQPVAKTTSVADTVRALAYSRTGRLAIGSGEPGRTGSVAVWDPHAGGALRQTQVGADAVEALAWGARSELFAGCGDHKVYLRSVEQTDNGVTLDDHNDRVVSVAVSPKGGSVFATGGMDKMVKVWDFATHKAVLNFDRSEDGVTGLAFLPNGSTLISGSLDGRLSWWNISYDAAKREYTGGRGRVVDAHPGGVTAIALADNGVRLVTGGEDRIVRIWEAQSGRTLKSFTDSTQPIYAVAISPDGKAAAAAGREGRVYVWNADTGRLVAIVATAALPVSPAPKKAVRRSAK